MLEAHPLPRHASVFASSSLTTLSWMRRHCRDMTVFFLVIAFVYRYNFFNAHVLPRYQSVASSLLLFIATSWIRKHCRDMTVFYLGIAFVFTISWMCRRCCEVGVFCLVFASCYILAAQTLLRMDSTFPRHYFCLSLHIRCAGIAAISECFPSSLLICYRYFLDTQALLRFCPVIVITTFWMRSCDVLECLIKLSLSTSGMRNPCRDIRVFLLGYACTATVLSLFDSTFHASSMLINCVLFWILIIVFV